MKKRLFTGVPGISAVNNLFFIPPIGGMKKRLFTGVPGISAVVRTKNLINIFELMITDELSDITVEHNDY